MIIALLVVGIVLVPVLLFALGVIFLRAGGSEGGVVGVAEQEVFPATSEFDMAMDVEIILESGPTISLPEALFPGEDRDVLEGSVQRVATVTSPAGSADLYTYEAILLDSANGDTMNCLGVINDFSSSVGCRSSEDSDHIVTWASEDRTSGTWYSVAVAGLPLEATTLVTETGAGRLVGSQVINGVAYQEWPAAEGSNDGVLPSDGREFGESIRTVALDAGGVVVWSTAGGN